MLILAWISTIYSCVVAIACFGLLASGKNTLRNRIAYTLFASLSFASLAVGLYVIITLGR